MYYAGALFLPWSVQVLTIIWMLSALLIDGEILNDCPSG